MFLSRCTVMCMYTLVSIINNKIQYMLSINNSTIRIISVSEYLQMKELLIRPLKRDFNCSWGIVV